jgi:putative transposase
MARIARVVIPEYPYHVTQRGNRRQKTFFCDDDYRYYIELMSEFSLKSETEIWAYCLMPNHVHLVMVPAEENGLRATLGEAHRRYTRYINFREGWRGHLWQERFHSFVMDESHLLSTVRYVEINPIVANLCDHPKGWSSARAHFMGEDDKLVRMKPMLERIDDGGAYLSDTDNGSNVDMIKQHTRTGRPLGSVGFIQKLESMIGMDLSVKCQDETHII